MFTSLRSALTLLWLFVVVVCGALAVQLYGLFQLGIGGQIAEVRHSIADAAKNVSQQYDLYRSSFTNSQPDFGNSEHERELLLLLDLALGRYNGIEGDSGRRETISSRTAFQLINRLSETSLPRNPAAFPSSTKEYSLRRRKTPLDTSPPKKYF